MKKNVVYFIVGNSPGSEFYLPTFRNFLSVPSSYAGMYSSYLAACEDETNRVF